MTHSNSFLRGLASPTLVLQVIWEGDGPRQGLVSAKKRTFVQRQTEDHPKRQTIVRDRWTREKDRIPYTLSVSEGRMERVPAESKGKDSCLSLIFISDLSFLLPSSIFLDTLSKNSAKEAETRWRPMDQVRYLSSSHVNCELLQEMSHKRERVYPNRVAIFYHCRGWRILNGKTTHPIKEGGGEIRVWNYFWAIDSTCIYTGVPHPASNAVSSHFAQGLSSR